MKLCYCDFQGNVEILDLSTEDLKTEEPFRRGNKEYNTYALKFNKNSVIPSNMKTDIKLENIFFHHLLEERLYEGRAGYYHYMLVNEADSDVAKHIFLKEFKASIIRDKEACLERIRALDKLYTTVDMVDHNELETNEEDIER